MTDTKLQELSEQVASSHLRTDQLVEQIAELTQQMARQNTANQQMTQQVAELTQQIARQNTDITQQIAERYSQLDNRISELADDPNGQTQQPRESPLTSNNSSPSSSSSRLYISGQASGLAFSMTSKSLLQTFFPSAIVGVALFLPGGSWAYTSFFNVHIVYAAANLGLTLIDAALTIACRHSGPRFRLQQDSDVQHGSIARSGQIPRN